MRMTVGELIEELKKYDHDLIVQTYNEENTFDAKEVQLWDYFGVYKTVVIR